MFNANRRRRAAWRPYKRSERINVPDNPYRGLYTICRIHADSPLLDTQQVPYREYRPPEDQSLMLLEINLEHFRDGAISLAALGNIDEALTHFAGCGVQLILRMVYDWAGQGILYEPLQQEIIHLHMQQLSPLFQKHKRIIYILQGLFTGSWGEMHNTRYASPSAMIALTDELLAATAPETFLAVRCPNFWRTIFRTYQPVGWSEVLQGTSASRVSLYNDAILGSDTDLGTYGILPRISVTSYSEAFCREDELRFQEQLCRYVPNGGEVINNSPLNDAKAAVETLQAMHVSYLNSDYDDQVVDKWRAGKGNAYGGIFRKVSDMEAISAHLGYRFLLQDTKLTRRKTSAGQRLTLEMEVVNHGYAPCYRRMEVGLLLAGDNGQVRLVPIDTDIRTWQPEKPVQLKATLPDLQDMGQTCYACLRIICPLTGREIQLLNTPDPLGKGYMNPLGEIKL